ncbi:MAG TPA: hypothetical protein VFZ91_16170 [Allosphingosinicella sp.]
MKVAILIPVNETVKAVTAQCLARMVSRTYLAKLAGPAGSISPIVETFIWSSSSIAYNRRRLVLLALEWGADYVLWVDGDMTFPPDGLLRLLAHGKAVVGTNYRRRNVESVLPTAARTRAGERSAMMPSGAGLKEADHIGLGFCLIEARVLRALKMPMFLEGVGPDGLSPTGEDVHFFERVREAGFAVHVDDDLSMEIGHMAETPLYFPR